MSFCEKLHPSERGLEITEKHHTLTFMPTAFFLWELLVFFPSQWDYQEVQAMLALSAKPLYFSSERFCVCFRVRWP